MRSEPITVLVVDDHPVVRSGFTCLLESDPRIQVKDVACSGEEALQLYHGRRPDVVVLDLNMPGMGGLETLRRLIAKDPKARILVFSMHDSAEMAARVIDAGAAGYLMKSSAVTQMVDAVHQANNGKIFLSQAMATDIISNNKARPACLGTLSEREFQVFQALAEGKMTAEIAGELFISPKTVEVHQTKIKKKLKLRNSAELSRLAIRHGIIVP